jgi:hypothetical protein
MMEVRELRFQVIPAPESNDHQVRIWIDGKDLIASYAPEMLGMDPDDLLDYDVLAPRDMPHEETIARCGCGEVGCGHASVTISLDGNRVVWDSWGGDLTSRNPGALKFSKDKYLNVLNNALADHTWETAERTAARILKSLVNRDALFVDKLKYQWASGRVNDGEFTISLQGPLESHQILLHVPWRDESPQEIAEKAAILLASDPRQWRFVSWYGANKNPPFKGPGWKK